ncbi:hypothetical protein BASA81_001912 [Batrachochytrium salamandrivorans]|nr:hypothetical protein BASA81_001912 [Batrachochytrium salamandrivorans]
MKLFFQSEASVLVVPGKLALVLEPGGACFHYIPPVSLPTRHITRFAAPKLQSLVKSLLDFRNSLVQRNQVYVCDELYTDQNKTVRKHHVAVLLPTTSRATGVWVQRKAGVPQSFNTSSSSGHPIEFDSSTEFLRQIQLAIHMDLKDVEINLDEVVCEETDEYCISCFTLNRWECLLLIEENSYMILQQDGFVQHLTEHGPSKLYSIDYVPREYSLAVARLVKLVHVPTLFTRPLPLCVPRLAVLHELVDLKGNIFTAFSDNSVLVRFQDRTLAKVLAEEPMVVHLLLNTGETCLATITNREGEDFGFARYIRPLERFLQTCFLDPVARAQIENATRLLQLRIHHQLCETRQVLQMNELAIKGARD